MIESFVDLTYRGLSLGRRVKLTQVRPSTGYVETPAPMPVGTAISIATDDGITLDAMVMAIHEQVGGSDRVPGMIVAPALADDAQQSWWKARVALPEEPPVSMRVKPVTVRPRTQTIVEAPLPEPVAAEPTLAMPAVEDEPPDGRTKVMDAIDQETLERLTRRSEEIPAVSTTGDHEVVDDGKKTMMMDAIDPAALGLDMGNDEDEADDPRKSSPGLPSSVKKRKKKR
jgi:hypothetical protein